MTLCAGLGLLHPHLPQCAHGRHVGKAVGLEALHPPALVVYANQQVGAHALDAFAQRGELDATFPIARKQNQAAHQRVAQALAVNGVQRRACDVDDQGRVNSHGVVGV